MNNKNPWAWVPTLYFAEGVPYVAVMTISVIIYKRLGLSNTDITLYTSWLYLPWVIKPLWSPFVDMLRTKRWWILSMQILIAAALAGVAFTIPGPFWLQGSLSFFWLLAFSSATHDIAADGFYMLGLEQHEQAYFVGIRSTFYRIATIFSSGLLVGLAGVLQVLTRSISYAWSLVFYLIAGLFIALWLYHSWALPRPSEDTHRIQKTAADIITEFWNTLVTFFQKPQVWVGICFMLFYRMPEGLLAKVSALFLVDKMANGGLGLSDVEFGMVQGTVGVIGLTLGGILGGIVASRDGLKRWLWPMVMAITIPDLVYVYLSCALPSSLLIINICIFLEQFGYGFGFSAYMLYLIYYSQGEHKTAHYALCTAFMALSMMIPGLFAGALQEAVGYRAFFVIVVVCCVMTYIVASLLKIDPEFGKKKENA
ncbi:MFS transporter, PAT family, beta-lactamase induction signal transducer AmpG [Xylanibacter ruminicola]|jgi:PAT family beta-lactamase induction signal transducer AmpG|uniref:MFS transporter, PAT family, beta-lactamase induction signal transducer AmpG n=2 Tax=Bacteroidales TaxID=171549 RepID=A0A1M7GDZ5_XYLRU|nr:MFS transporter [Xylanibacter ruminicola]MDO4985471.1 MFS transporter [Prevotella sp.]SFC09270.1 MFS transporter, PAT family, beta-lactamase induction signal transducer AmpG [Xylanibacter ruminicola]SHM14592.1 MFS transporter, PAT family, beta-lactamase induction signal transducer AmpG [Xylanibacter ruminicola]